MSGTGNGNRLKGNAQKKASRTNKNSSTSFDDTTDQYGLIERLVGGRHIEVKTLKNNKPIMANIPGRFYKRVWFNKGDIVIVTQVAENMLEIKGKPSEDDLPKIRYQFDKMDRANGDSRGIIQFGDYDDSDDEEAAESNNEKTENKSNKFIPKDRNKDQHKGMARVVRVPEEKKEFNFEDI